MKIHQSTASRKGGRSCEGYARLPKNPCCVSLCPVASSIYSASMVAELNNDRSNASTIADKPSAISSPSCDADEAERSIYHSYAINNFPLVAFDVRPLCYLPRKSSHMHPGPRQRPVSFEYFRPCFVGNVNLMKLLAKRTGVV